MKARPALAVDVVESAVCAPVKGASAANSEPTSPSTSSIFQSYFFAEWNPTAYDALLVAAVVEFADRTLRRSTMNWPREFVLNIPVHDAAHWNRQGRFRDAERSAGLFDRRLLGDQLLPAPARRWSARSKDTSACSREPLPSFLSARASIHDASRG